MLDNLWLSPPAGLVLDDDDVHVWRADLDQPEPFIRQLAGMLSDDERERADHFHFDIHRDHFIVGRGLLREILGRYLNVEPGRLQFSYGRQGKPGLLNSDGDPGLRFNLAHSGQLALCAVTRNREIGVDLEYVRPVLDMDLVAERNFSPRENAVLQALPPGERPLAFFNCWTRKEAYIKAIGEGLSRPLDQFDVSLAPGEPARLLWVAGNPQEASCWSLRELAVATGYVAALAVEGQDWSLTCRQWQAANLFNFRQAK
ncbi:MAG: 4'-phosphopantetheinyl transferase superfamily protein [Chloroflexota bacterium]